MRGIAADLARPAALYVGSRIVVLLAMWAGSIVHGLMYANQQVTVATQMRRWDGSWYVQVVRFGYPDTLPMADGHAAQSTIAFFPGFPLIARGLRFVTGLGPLAAAVVVAAVFGLAACLLLWVLTRRLTDSETADRAVALFAFFPGSFVLSMPYSEPVMLTLSIACIIFLLRRQWLLAGVAAALATATRPNAIAIVLCVAFEAALFMWSRRRPGVRPILAVLLAPLGFLGFMAFLWIRTGEATAWFEAQRHGWGERLSLTASFEKVADFVAAPTADANVFVTVVGLAVVVAAGALLLRSNLPPVLLVYTAAIVGLALLSETLGARPRFVLTAFPLFIAAGLKLRGVWFSTTLAMSATLLGVLTILSLNTIAVTP